MALRVLVLLCLVGSVQAATVRGAERTTNVLFLISDDLNNALGCYGDPLAKTPNLDALAARGVRFEHAYCNYPLCGPSRNSLLTGLYPNSTGILGNSQIFRQTIPSQVSLPQAFRHHGYLATRIGKLYHYNVPGAIGTDGHDDPASWEQKFNPAGVDHLEEEPHIFSLAPGNYGSALSWYASPNSDEHHTDGLMAKDASWVLERCAQQPQRPFFLAVGFFRPHTPFVAPKPYFDLHPEAKMPVVQGVEEDQRDIPEAALLSRKKEEEKLTDPLRRQAVQAYYASISFLDAQVGQVVDTLDRLGLAENTIIVFTSDHGYHLGEHGLWKKQSLFEQSARVPLLIVAPGGTRGGVVQEPVGLVDVYPTLTEWCGIPAPDNLQGQSLVPMLKDPTVQGRGWALTQMVRGGGGARKAAEQNPDARARGLVGYSLRTARWRYTEWNEGQRGRELYDHDNDPQELTNLADDPAHASTVAQLRQQLHAAVASSFPADGQTPALQSRPWTPVIK